MTAVTIRAMTIADIAGVDQIQRQCYTELEPESVQSLSAKLRASPGSCFIAESALGMQGYIIAIPWLQGQVPPLNAADCVLPAEPDCLYLHDLAVAPAARGSGAATLLVQQVLAVASNQTVSAVGLVAVQGSVPYWQRYGFAVYPPDRALTAKLATYGRNIHYMVAVNEHAEKD
ncbi:GNAT family N-acetyltransferase [Chromatiaceae bacterium AAb-1]|nr:GNAT family N-acetyltransferase [Chromatiaceae bacterium AAb-1]